MENAIKHGVSASVDSSKVQLSAYEDDQFIFVSLKNDLNQNIFRNGQTAETRISAATGTGLKNSMNRLELMFGDNSKFEVFHTATDFEVKFSFPACFPSPFPAGLLMRPSESFSLNSTDESKIHPGLK